MQTHITPPVALLPVATFTPIVNPISVSLAEPYKIPLLQHPHPIFMIATLVRHTYTRKRALLAHPQTPLRMSSPAQSCNEDVLREITALLSKPDLAAVAQVYHSWLPSAQYALYRYIDFDTYKPRAVALSNTLSKSPHLRTLVRDLSISHLPPADGALSN